MSAVPNFLSLFFKYQYESGEPGEFVVIRNLYFPVEVGTRELFARCLTACFAAEQGFNILIGHQGTLLAHANTLPQGVFLNKSTNALGVNNMGVLQDCGHGTAVCEEENFFRILKNNPITYSNKKLPNVCDRYLAMGADEEASLGRMFGDAFPMVRAGNARTDILRPEMRSMFESEVESIKQKYGSFILVNSNLGITNSASGESPPIQFQRWEAMGLFDEGVNQEERVKVFEDFLTFEQGNMESLVGVLRLLDASGVTAVMRPHPGENLATWQKFLAKLSGDKIHLDNTGSHIPFLLASQLVVHTACTTGVEAVLLDVPALSIQSNDAKAHSYYLSNRFNATCRSAEEAMDLIDGHMKGGSALRDVRPRMITEMAGFLDGLDTGPFASELIVQNLTELFDVLVQKNGGQPENNRRKLEIGQEDKHYLSNFYVRQKYGVTEEVFGETMAKIKQALGRFATVKWGRISDSTYKVFSSAG